MQNQAMAKSQFSYENTVIETNTNTVYQTKYMTSQKFGQNILIL